MPQLLNLILKIYRGHLLLQPKLILFNKLVLLANQVLCAATAVLQATGNLVTDIASNLQTPVYNALLQAGTTVGTQYINSRGAQATNNIGLLQG